MVINLIVAVSEEGVIGANNDLVWKLSDDLKRFKSLTQNKVVVMGRKTYESIGSKPLPNRLNIVITRNPQYKVERGVLLCTSLDEAIELLKSINGVKESYIIGGGEIYKQALEKNVVNNVYLTKVHASVKGDTYFDYDDSNWELVNEKFYKADEKNHFPFTFKDYKLN